MYSSKIIAKCLLAAAVFGLAPGALFADNSTTTTTGNMPHGMMQQGNDGELTRLREENRRLKEENEKLKRQIEQMRNRGGQQGNRQMQKPGNMTTTPGSSTSTTTE